MTDVAPRSVGEAGAAIAAPPAKRPRWRLSPINARRLANFRANRRGYWAFVIFSTLFVLSLFAEFIANDRPLVARYKGEILFPVLVNYPEEKFGGFLAKTDYRDPVIQKEINANGWMVWPPIRFSYETQNLEVPTPAPSPPTWRLTDAQCRDAAARLERNQGRDRESLGCRDIEWNWLGTDDQTRDVLARLIYGFRLSVLFGLALTLVSSLVGVALGAVQGYYGGFTDLTLQRIIEIWGAIPSLYVLLIFSNFFPPSFFTLLFILLLFAWMSLVHVVRAEFLRARNFDYVRAARALGLADGTIIMKHVLPNAMVATLTMLPFILSGAVNSLTALDFLGLGMPPGSPSLGDLLRQGKANLTAPWLALTGFFVIATTLSLLIFIGEAVRDAFDPRKAFA
jgi:microcin C transport system permease protein